MRRVLLISMILGFLSTINGFSISNPSSDPDLFGISLDSSFETLFNKYNNDQTAIGDYRIVDGNGLVIFKKAIKPSILPGFVAYRFENNKLINIEYFIANSFRGKKSKYYKVMLKQKSRIEKKSGLPVVSDKRGPDLNKKDFDSEPSNNSYWFQWESNIWYIRINYLQVDGLNFTIEFGKK